MIIITQMTKKKQNKKQNKTKKPLIILIQTYKQDSLNAFLPQQTKYRLHTIPISNVFNKACAGCVRV
jgi:hypothetical protein